MVSENFDDNKEAKSHIYIGERTSSEKNVNSWISNANIDPDNVCVIFLGGDGTLTERAANGYAKTIQNLLRVSKLDDKVKVFSAHYDFGSFLNPKKIRTNLFKKFNRTLGMKPDLETSEKEDYNKPQYVQELFYKIILPRISKNDGTEKLSAEDAKTKIRKLNIITHCHGAAVVLQLEELMQQKLKELNYSETEINEIQKKLLVVSHSPYCPLGVNKSTMVSFASANDCEVEHYNNFHKYIKDERDTQNFGLNFFEGKKGNLFMVHKKFEDDDGFDDEDDDPFIFSEHSFYGYSSYGLTPEGEAANKIAKNIIINGIKDSFNQSPELNIEKLSQAGSLFDVIKKNGNKLYYSTLTYLHNKFAKSRGAYD